MSHDFRTAALAGALGACLLTASAASAALVTDPNDARSWQGASVGTFAQLFFGTDDAVTRQQVIDQQLLDDGIFSASGATAAPLISAVGIGGTGQSTDMTGTGSYAYIQPGGTPQQAGGAVDALWVQTDNTVGHAVWDLGAPATKAAIFNTIDHGPLPQEAIESTVYLSNDQTNWTQAVTERVWLEGFMPNTNIKWDGFSYAVGTGSSATFRYASIIWGGPGALQADGDNEINGILGLDADFNPTTPSEVPVPATLPLLLAGLGALGLVGRGLVGRGLVGSHRRRNA